MGRKQPKVHQKGPIVQYPKHYKVTEGRVGETRNLLYKLQSGRCFYCLDKLPSSQYLTRDHLVPKSKGGKGSIKNLVGACYFCNSLKGDHEVNPDWVSERIDLFNHRDWDRGDFGERKNTTIPSPPTSSVPTPQQALTRLEEVKAALAQIEVNIRLLIAQQAGK